MPARALVYQDSFGDYRIKWTGAAGDAESGHQYVTREKATLVAILCHPEKVEQDYGPV